MKKQNISNWNLIQTALWLKLTQILVILVNWTGCKYFNQDDLNYL